MVKLVFIFLFFYSIESYSQCPPLISPSVSIRVNGTYCKKLNYTLAAVLNGISSDNMPTYQWQKNGIITEGYNNMIAPYKGNTLNRGDLIKCVVTLNDSCNYHKTFTDSLKIFYSAYSPAALNVNPTGTITPNTLVTFTGTVNSLIGRLDYKYFLNGKVISQSDSLSASSNIKDSNGRINVVYQNNSFKNGDAIYLVTQFTNPCETVDTSNIIVMSVRSVLPIAFSNFKVRSTTKTFILNWSTTKERNMDYFNVQASSDNISFKTFKRVNAAGKSISLKQYRDTIVPNTSNKTYYLRLQMVEKDGNVTYSPTEMAELYPLYPIDSISAAQNKSDSILNVKEYNDSVLKQSKDTNSSFNQNNYSIANNLQLNGDSIISVFADTMTNSLINKYLILFDNIYRSKDYLLDSVSNFISTPTQKVKFLITYCLLSHILPTRTSIESCLRMNLCFLYQKQFSINYNIISPLSFKIRHKEIKKIMNEYYRQMDSLKEVSIDNHIDEKNVYKRFNSVFFNTAMIENEFLKKDIPVNLNKWRIAFCIYDENGEEVKNAFSVSYHPYKLEPNKVDNASLAFAELPPGDIYLAVSKNNSNKNLQIKENVIYVKEEINNASLDPIRRVVKYDSNKALSRANTFIIFIHLLK